MKKLYFLLSTILITSLSFGQTTVFQESFETGNSATVSEDCNDGYDFFTVSDGSDLPGTDLSNMDGTFFFAAQDTDGAPCTMAIETMEFTGIDISTYSNLSFAVLVAEDDSSDGNEDWDADTNVLIEVNVDGAGYTNMFQFSGGGATNTEPGLDTNFDGTADSTPLTSVFTEFVGAMTSGNSADIRITFTNLNAGDEDIAIDNIRIIDGFTVSPSIIAGPAVSGLNYVVGGTSSEGTFTVEGANLTNNIVLTAPSDFEIREDAGSFVASITLTQSGGIVNSQTIHARLKSGLAVNSYSADVDVTSTGAAPKTVTLSGNVFNPATNALVITGAYDGPLPTGTPKGIELYVIQDIADLSIFGLGSANNGGGSDGQEFTFPADAATAGSYIYVSTEAPNFTTFFGFAPTYTDGAMGINGDDAVELFESGQVIDVFGTIDCDPNDTGSACPEWEHTDGWAYRNTVGPSTTFLHTEWDYSGVGNLDGATNGPSTSPFPIGTYDGLLSTVKSSIEGFAVYPNPVNNGEFSISSFNNATKQIQIFDMLGKQVYSNVVKANENVQVSNLNTGIYILKVLEEGKTATRKLVIQ
ncbi:MAG: hypothetical protein COA67_11125 [Lutibacter sp.]|nr:MAG: hypothetical protein COA67_11125 [Lutibacter sp.]